MLGLINKLSENVVTRKYEAKNAYHSKTNTSFTPRKIQKYIIC